MKIVVSYQNPGLLKALCNLLNYQLRFLNNIGLSGKENDAVLSFVEMANGDLLMVAGSGPYTIKPRSSAGLVSVPKHSF